MTGILGRIFPDRSGAPAPTRGDIAYADAMAETERMLTRIRQSSNPTNGVVIDIIAQRENVPFVTTVYETVQEMKAPLEQSPDDH